MTWRCVFKEGLVEVRELEKGVSALVGVAAAHPRLRAHRPAPAPAPGTAPAPAPALRDLYCITARVAPLFAPLK